MIGAGFMMDANAKMKDVHHSKQTIKNYKKLAKSYKYSVKKNEIPKITAEEFEIIYESLKGYRKEQRKTTIIFLIIFIPIIVLVCYGVLKLLA